LIPAERLDQDFFCLRTGVAGALLQKFATYGKRVWFARDIVDVDPRLGQSQNFASD
jgi:hypothetical protein